MNGSGGAFGLLLTNATTGEEIQAEAEVLAATTVNVKRVPLSRVMSAMPSAADTARSNLSSCQPSNAFAIAAPSAPAPPAPAAPPPMPAASCSSDPRCADPRRQTSQPQRLSAVQMMDPRLAAASAQQQQFQQQQQQLRRPSPPSPRPARRRPTASR